MHIVYLNPCGSMGGAETSLLTLLAGIREAEPDWHLTLILGAEGPLREKAEALGVSVRMLVFPGRMARLGDSGLSRAALIAGAVGAIAPTFLYYRKLARALRELQPHLIHTNGFKMHVLGSWARPSRVPLIWHIHDYLRSRPVIGKTLAWHTRVCAAVIANSRSVAADISLALKSKVPVELLYNAIDLDHFSPEGPVMDLDEQSGMPVPEAGVLRVGMVATFARWKGQKVFLEALSLLPPGLAFRGYVIGGPIYQTTGSQFSLEELRADARRLGIEHKVGLTGFVDNPSAAMRALDIVVHASTEPEPFGMVIAEGMACGKAVVASSAGGALEVFEDGRTGLGHTAGNPAELACRIEQLAQDGSLRARLANAGRAASCQRFSRRRLAEELVAVYRKVSRESASANLLAPAHP